MLSIFGNESAPNAQWQPEPDGRGTASLLQTCLLTILLCVYNSVHLNIPIHKDSEWRKFYAKSKFVILALFAPEILTYFAWAQRTDAKTIANALNKTKGYPSITPTSQKLWQNFRKAAGLLGKCFQIGTKDTDVETDHASTDSKIGTSSQHQAFTLTHGFFILMGGLAFDVSEDPIRIWPKGVDRMFIDASLLIACYENGFENEIMPSTFVSEKNIKDKSKADRYAKTFVCLQALWFCLQFFTRIAQGLPVSLIELNTLAHSLCALLIYVFWWSKPFDIQEPITIPTGRSERTRALCASASYHSCVESYFSLKTSWMKACQMVARKKRMTSFHDRIENLRARLYLHIGPDSTSDAERLCKGEFSPSDTPVLPLNFCGMNLGSAWRMSAFLHYPAGYKASNVSFEGLDLTSKDYRFVSHDPPVILLKQGDEIPGTPYRVACKDSYELDEITLRRLRWASRLDLSFTKPKNTNLIFWPLARRRQNEYKHLLHGHSSQMFTGLSLQNDIITDVSTLKREERLDQMEGHEQAFGVLQWVLRDSSIRQLATSQNLAIISSGLIYGGIQALAIGVPLHSTTESLLWKLSTLTVAGGGFFFVSVTVLSDYIPYLLYQWCRSKARSTSRNRAFAWAAWIFYCLCYIVGRAAALLYILARIFLVVEVFLNVAWAPAGVYRTPNWSLYMPHLT